MEMRLLKAVSRRRKQPRKEPSDGKGQFQGITFLDEQTLPPHPTEPPRVCYALTRTRWGLSTGPGLLTWFFSSQSAGGGLDECLDPGSVLCGHL